MTVCESLDLSGIETPVYVIDLQALRKNLQVLDSVRNETECNVLLALKGFAAWSTFSLIGQYLDGIAASSPDEARLGSDKFGKQVHTYSPAFSTHSLELALKHSDHVSFNSVSQVERFRTSIEHARDRVSFGLRVNPQHSEVQIALYDPCMPGSRLGATPASMIGTDLSLLDGLHFHTLCELGVNALARTVTVFEQKFAPWLETIQWVNFGGGQLITHSNYDVAKLIDLIRHFKKQHGVQVTLEPGEAIALNAGVLIASVLDIVENDGEIAILDTSATAHMPDVLEMPYRPQVRGASNRNEARYTYQLGGLSCLAGDVIGRYAFDHPLQVGDRLIFEDMAHYTMVKNTTFNGLRSPSIATFEPTTGQYIVQRAFHYEDYCNRL